jgi:carboxypeptidase Taq
VTESPAYQELLRRMAELADLGGAAALLSWDQETYMPEGAQQARGAQMATLGAISHQKFTCDEVGDLLQRLQGPEAPGAEEQRTAVERTAWDYARATRIPESLVRDMAQAQSESVACWSQARPANDFARWRPFLERLLDLTRQEADCLKTPGQSRYDALLEGFERGASSAAIAKVFTDLRVHVVDLVKRIGQSKRPVDEACAHRPLDPQRQWDFSLEVLRDMGFDLNRGRVDKSAHPFTSGFHPTDVRLTSRVQADNFPSCFYSVLHEGGHGLYEQGIAEADWGTPLGSSISLGIHESQSRMWENLVGRSLPFWKHCFPRLLAAFPSELAGVTVTDYHRAVNAVRPSLIRVEADEVTYSLHIILRFEIEQALLEGTLAPADLPEAWRAKMRDYFGIEPSDDRDGCMQDIHWAWGMIGYFPTYTLGNLYSAQFFEQARRDIPDLEERIASGDLATLREWLRAKIHRVGRRRLAEELVRDVTGKALTAEPYVAYLKAKFGAIYAL